MNLVIINPSSRSIDRVAHFDTYAEDSSPLEIFLEGVSAGEIVVGATFDDASRKLSDLARQLFNELGAGNSQVLFVMVNALSIERVRIED